MQSDAAAVGAYYTLFRLNLVVLPVFIVSSFLLSMDDEEKEKMDCVLRHENMYRRLRWIYGCTSPLCDASDDHVRMRPCVHQVS